MDMLDAARKPPRFKKAPRIQKPLETATPPAGATGPSSSSVPPPAKDKSPVKRRLKDYTTLLPPKRSRQSGLSEGEGSLDATPLYVGIGEEFLENHPKYDNPLLKAEFLTARTCVIQWMMHTDGYIDHLEQLPAKLKDSKKECRRLAAALKAKEEEVAAAKREAAKFKDMLRVVTQESIISYVATYTYAANRLEEFWKNVGTFITLHVSDLITYVRDVEGIVVDWDPNWLTHERVHELCRVWREEPEPSDKLAPIPMRPLGEKALWDLEILGAERRKELIGKRMLESSGETLAQGFVPDTGDNLKSVQKRKGSSEPVNKVTSQSAGSNSGGGRFL